MKQINQHKCSLVVWISAILMVLIAFQQSNAQKRIDFDESLYKALEYRCVGPFRGGRSAAFERVC